MPRLTLLFCVFTLLCSACAHSPIDSAADAMRLTDDVPGVNEGIALGPLIQGIEDQIEHLQRTRRFQEFRFGTRVISKADYLRGLGHVVQLAGQHQDYKSFWQAVRSDFDFYEVYGRDEWGEVFITSYYEPVLQGSRKRTRKFSQPLYGLPHDLVEVRIREFGDEFRTAPRVLRGRIVRQERQLEADAEIFADSGELANGYVVPYFSREEIDRRQSLRGKRLEICWVDPLDAFILQIQGSGVIEFPSGRRVRVGYAGQNGHAYEAVGKFLKHVIPLEEMTLHRIEQYLRSIPHEDMMDYLDRNPSYVFFKPLRQNAVTYLGTSAVAGRTIATDRKFFPKGALALMQFEVPVFADASAVEPESWQKVTRLMLDQDVGGAIKGPGRVDIFWGSGAEAKQAAGVIKQTGRLYYLAPKEKLLDIFRQREQEGG